MIVVDLDEAGPQPYMAEPDVEMGVFARAMALEARDTKPETPEQAEALETKKQMAEYLGGDKMIRDDEETIQKYSDHMALAKKWADSNLRFISNYVKIRGEDDGIERTVELENFQKIVSAGKYSFLILLKARRIGGTWILDADSVADAWTKAGLNSTFMSTNLSLARDRMLNVLDIIELLPPNVRGRRRKIGSGYRAKIELQAPDGRRQQLRSFPQIEPRGFQGNIHLDEVATYRDERAIIRAAVFSASRTKGKITLTSTPRSKGDLFHALCERFSEGSRIAAAASKKVISDKMLKGFRTRFLKVPWWESRVMVREGMYEQALEICPTIPSTVERIERFASDALVGIFEFLEESIPDFQMEEECVFFDEKDAFYNHELLSKNLFDPDGDEKLISELAEDGCDRIYSLFEKNAVNAGVETRWFWKLEDFIRAYKQGRIRGDLYLGVDPGGGDGAAVVVTEKVGDLAICRYHVKFRKKDLGNVDPYDRLEKHVMEIGKNVRIVKAGVDCQGGFGDPLVRAMRRTTFYGRNRVESIMPTDITNYEMANDIWVRMESGLCGIPDEQGIRHGREYSLGTDFMKVRRHETKDGRVTIKIRRDETGHGDTFCGYGYSIMMMPEFKKKAGIQRPAGIASKMGFKKQRFNTPKTDLVSDFGGILTPNPSILVGLDPSIRFPGSGVAGGFGKILGGAPNVRMSDLFPALRGK